MRICYLCADLGIEIGGHKGASAHLRGLVKAMDGLGHDVLVVSPNPGDTEVTVVPTQVPHVAKAVRSSDSNRPLARALGHLWHNVAVERTLNEVLPSFGADLLYERYSPFGVAGGVVSRLLRIPHVLEVNAPLAWEGKRYRQQALSDAAEFLEQTAFATASLIVTVSAELRETLVESGVSADKIRVVPNGVDPDLFSPVGESLPDGLDGKFVVGFVGSLKPWHGVELLADAFRQLVPDPRFHLLVVGQGPMSKVLGGFGKEFPDRLTLVGAVPQRDVPSYVRAMDVALAVYPRLERFYFSPLKVLEYMAAGRAVVASRSGQIAELIDDGETGILVPPADPPALATAIRRLADDEALRRGLGEAAAAEVRRHHTWSQRATQILDFSRALG